MILGYANRKAPEMELLINDEVISLLNKFKELRKFDPIEFQVDGFDHPLMEYVGAPTEEIRKRCEKLINDLVSELMEGLPLNSNKTFVLDMFKKHLENFRDEDTEEREQATGYCEDIMDILLIESSDGVLNRFLYELDPNEYII